MRFRYADLLGSSTLGTDNTGTVLQNTNFDPFGTLLDLREVSGATIAIGSSATRYLYTDQENGAETGLIYTGRRRLQGERKGVRRFGCGM